MVGDRNLFRSMQQQFYPFFMSRKNVFHVQVAVSKFVVPIHTAIYDPHTFKFSFLYKDDFAFQTFSKFPYSVYITAWEHSSLNFLQPIHCNIL